MKNHLTRYLKSLKSSLNFIRNSIISALKSNVIELIIRSLGIVSKIITEPYWHLSEEVKTAIDMGSIYRRLISLLEEYYNSPEFMLRNELKFVCGPSLPDDEVSQALFEPSANVEESKDFFLILPFYEK